MSSNYLVNSLLSRQQQRYVPINESLKKDSVSYLIRERELMFQEAFEYTTFHPDPYPPYPEDLVFIVEPEYKDKIKIEDVRWFLFHLFSESEPYWRNVPFSFILDPNDDTLLRLCTDLPGEPFTVVLPRYWLNFRPFDWDVVDKFQEIAQKYHYYMF